MRRASAFLTLLRLILATLSFYVTAHAQSVSNFVPLPPCRLVDTRDADRGLLGSPALVAMATRDFPVLAGSCNVPPGSTAYSINVTVVPHQPFSYLTAWPTGQSQPLVSTLNAYSGGVTANGAIVPAGASGAISVFVTGNTDLIVDINGYFTPPTTQVTDNLNQQLAQLQQQLATLSTSLSQLATTNQMSSLQQQITSLNASVKPIPGLQQQVSALNIAIAEAASSTQLSSLQQQVGSLNTIVGQVPALVTAADQIVNTVKINQAQGDIAFGKDASLSGSQNSALGSQSLQANLSGIGNTAVGAGSLASNIRGNSNVGLGLNALSSIQAGNENIAIGYQSASLIGDGSNVIEIGNLGQPGDQAVIRIGTQGIQQSASMAGIYSAPTDGTGVGVMVDENGTLGTFQSSIRYKEDVRDIGLGSENLMKLRPVQFRYKKKSARGDQPVQYGLIAEEVQSVFPNLVVHDSQGRPETVQYHQLPALMLNELQKQNRKLEQQQRLIEDQGHQISMLLATMCSATRR